MKKASLYLAIAAMASLTLGCKKDSDTTTPAAATKTDLLTAKNWRLTDVKVSGASVYALIYPDPCAKDDFIKFNTNKSATFDEGTLRCNSNDPQTQAGSWEFTTNETKLKYTNPDGDVLEGGIDKLDATALVLSNPSYEATPGTTVAAELTFVAQ